jgi:thiamine-phosphate pyrophosphorylase
LRLPPVYAILDVDVAAARGWAPLELARAYVDGGVRFLQVRGKALSSAVLLDLAAEVVALSRPCGALVVVNDRADVAVAAGASGVHVGQDDLSPDDARAVVGSDRLVGVSTHTPAQIERAAASSADYIAVGPIFGTRTKDTGYAPVGLELVRLAAGSGKPVVAIGGITLARAPEVVAAGAVSLAVIADLLAHGHPREGAAAFVARLSGRAGTV